MVLLIQSRPLCPQSCSRGPRDFTPGSGTEGESHGGLFVFGGVLMLYLLFSWFVRPWAGPILRAWQRRDAARQDPAALEELQRAWAEREQRDR